MKPSTNVDEPICSSLAEYFKEHPDEEAGYIDDMAAIAEEESVREIPEDW